MGFVSHRVNADELKPGDHIYTWRAGFTYSHHGIYVGGNKVIHFTSDQAKATSGSGLNLSSSGSILSSFINPTNCEFSQPIRGRSCSSGSCLCTYYCGFHQPESGVTLSCLKCFVKTGSLYLYQYGVTKWMHISRIRGGTCTIAPSDPPQLVIDRAIYLLRQEKGFGNYNLFKSNCEDFALYCKTELLLTGKGLSLYPRISSQVNSTIYVPKHVITAVVGAIPILMCPPLGVMIFWKNSWYKYKADVGVRRDVVKVPKERLGSFKLERGY